jgi:hypothetical protein
MPVMHPTEAEATTMSSPGPCRHRTIIAAKSGLGTVIDEFAWECPKTVIARGINTWVSLRPFRM